ncbi:hypothetical protein HDU67_007660 [Dinochytrium kinnereticum]|nr:hypothetical protein HDU67_007660 [Dinochytrium kinnereticum]
MEGRGGGFRGGVHHRGRGGQQPPTHPLHTLTHPRGTSISKRGGGTSRPRGASSFSQGGYPTPSTPNRGGRGGRGGGVPSPNRGRGRGGKKRGGGGGGGGGGVITTPGKSGEGGGDEGGVKPFSHAASGGGGRMPPWWSDGLGKVFEELMVLDDEGGEGGDPTWTKKKKKKKGGEDPNLKDAAVTSLLSRLDLEIASFSTWSTPPSSIQKAWTRLAESYTTLVQSYHPRLTMRRVGSTVLGVAMPWDDVDLAISVPGSTGALKHQVEKVVKILQQISNSPAISATADKITKAVRTSPIVLHPTPHVNDASFNPETPVNRFWRQSVRLHDSAMGSIVDVGCFSVFSEPAPDEGLNVVKELICGDSGEGMTEWGKVVVPLVRVLKQFLFVRGMMAAVGGGVSRLGLPLGALAFVRVHPLLYGGERGDASDAGSSKATFPPLPPNLTKSHGALLLDFCHLFGKCFDFSAGMAIHPFSTYPTRIFTISDTYHPVPEHVEKFTTPSTTPSSTPLQPLTKESLILIEPATQRRMKFAGGGKLLKMVAMLGGLLDDVCGGGFVDAGSVLGRVMHVSGEELRKRERVLRGVQVGLLGGEVGGVKGGGVVKKEEVGSDEDEFEDAVDGEEGGGEGFVDAPEVLGDAGVGPGVAVAVTGGANGKVAKAEEEEEEEEEGALKEDEEGEEVDETGSATIEGGHDDGRDGRPLLSNEGYNGQRDGWNRGGWGVGHPPPGSAPWGGGEGEGWDGYHGQGYGSRGGGRTPPNGFGHAPRGGRGGGWSGGGRGRDGYGGARRGGRGGEYGDHGGEEYLEGGSPAPAQPAKGFSFPPHMGWQAPSTQGGFRPPPPLTASQGAAYAQPVTAPPSSSQYNPRPPLHQQPPPQSPQQHGGYRPPYYDPSAYFYGGGGGGSY